jgi:hypothetical protein
VLDEFKGGGKMQRNVELLERTMGFIEDGGKWNQWGWRTCFAGRACTLAGWHCLSPGGQVRFKLNWITGIRFGTVFHIAVKELGLCGYELNEIISGYNTKRDLRRYVDDLVEETKPKAHGHMSGTYVIDRVRLEELLEEELLALGIR